MLAYLGSLLKEQSADEDLRIAKTVSKQEAKLLQEEYFKEMKYRKDLMEIKQHREEMVNYTS